MKDKKATLRITFMVIYLILFVLGLSDLFKTGGRIFKYVFLTAVVLEPINTYVNIFCARKEETTQKYVKRYTGKFTTFLLILLLVTIVTVSQVVYKNWFGPEFNTSRQLLADTKAAVSNSFEDEAFGDIINKVDSCTMGTYGSYALTTGLIMLDFATNLAANFQMINDDSTEELITYYHMDYIEEYADKEYLGTKYIVNLYHFEKDIAKICKALADKSDDEQVDEFQTMSLNYGTKYIIKETEDILKYFKTQTIIYVANVLFLRYFVRWISSIIMCKAYKRKQDKIIEV